MNESFPFKGSGTDDGTHMILEGDKGGKFRVAKTDIENKNSENFLKEGVVVEILELPNNPDKSLGRTDPACDGGPTACIGLVEICCGSGKVIHACVGVWGCP